MMLLSDKKKHFNEDETKSNNDNSSHQHSNS